MISCIDGEVAKGASLVDVCDLVGYLWPGAPQLGFGDEALLSDVGTDRERRVARGIALLGEEPCQEEGLTGCQRV